MIAKEEGTVKWFSDHKGFGFISMDHPEDNIESRFQLNKDNKP